jgi:ribosomal protein S16
MYDVKIKFEGTVSWVQVPAHDSGQAKRLVQEQYGDKVQVLEARPAN